MLNCKDLNSNALPRILTNYFIKVYKCDMLLILEIRGHGGVVVTHSTPTSEVGGSNP